MACIALTVQSCKKDLPTQLEFDLYQFASDDPNGGTWKPVLLSSATQFPVPAPAPTSSQEYQQELAELKTLASNASPAQKEAARYWGNNPGLRWNEIARELAAKYNLPPAPNPDGTYSSPNPANPGVYPLFPFAHPPYACRMFAYLSNAHFDALIAAWHYKYEYERPAPKRIDASIPTLYPDTELPSYPAEGAVIAGAAQVILAMMFPLEAEFLAQKAEEHRNSLMWAGAHVASDISAGRTLGQRVAALYMERARTDGMSKAQASRAVSDSLAAAAEANFGWKWINLEGPQRPVGITPLFGQVRLWFIPNVETVRPPAPPAIGSPAFEADMAELNNIRENLTDEQRRIANFWSDGLGTYTPPGHWNRFASDAIVQYRYNPLRAARVYAYMNMAIMDAGISCWDAKYYYHYPRPIQAAPGFKTILGTPNFPAYTSGHSSFSAAAATVLSHIFPAETQQFNQWAEEAAMSRLYGGIHYRFDAEVGNEQGRACGAFTIAVAQNDGAE